MTRIRDSSPSCEDGGFSRSLGEQVGVKKQDRVRFPREPDPVLFIKEGRGQAFFCFCRTTVTLSRMDEEESPLKLSDFAVSEAVEETAESFRDFARSQGHPLELAIVPGLTYCGDEYAVRQLVSILLDNAVKYALPETPIRFVLEKGKRGVVLRCSNACIPLAEGETEKLFDRFYRSDQARSADGSFGVGLSIARSIAEGHHGFIRAQCPQPGEIVFTAQLR